MWYTYVRNIYGPYILGIHMVHIYTEYIWYKYIPDICGTNIYRTYAEQIYTGHMRNTYIPNICVPTYIYGPHIYV